MKSFEKLIKKKNFKVINFLDTLDLKKKKTYSKLLENNFFFSKDLNKKQKNFLKSKLKILERKILFKLSKSLNEIHNTKYSSKFWDILLGHWINYYVGSVYRHYSNINHLNKVNKIKVKNLGRGDFNYTIHGTEDFIFLTNNFNWNRNIIFQICNQLKSRNQYYNKKFSVKKSFEIKKDIQVNDLNYKNILKKLYNFLCEFLKNDNEPFIQGTYLNRIDEFLLKLRFSFLPKYWLQKKFIKIRKDKEKRLLIYRKMISFKSNNKLEKILCNLIHDNLPTFFLEGFKRNLSLMQSVKWPKKPKFIFTSNNFETDEIFKLYSAINIEKKIKYIVGQHGNIYGTHFISSDYTEIRTSDKFISWGWKTHKKIIPSFMFSKKNNNIFPSKSGKILFIISPHFHNYNTYNKYSNMVYKLKKNIELLNNLPKNIKDNIFIRIIPSQTKKEFKEFFYRNDLFFLDHEFFLRKYVKNIQFDKRDKKLDYILGDYSLVLHNYDGTSFNDTAYHNFPSIALWYSSLDNYTSSAKKIYKNLFRNNIIHFTNDSVNTFLQKNFKDNYFYWWNNKKVKLSMKNFTEMYAKRNKTNNKIANFF